MSKKILIIDDDKTNVKILQAGLEGKGYFVNLALNGTVGLDRAKAGSPDLILLDIEMPEINGYTFMLELQKDPQLKDTAVIVLTSHGEMQPIFNFNGVKGYMVKPLKINEVYDKIERIFGKDVGN